MIYRPLGPTALLHNRGEGIQKEIITFPDFCQFKKVQIIIKIFIQGAHITRSGFKWDPVK